ncbi:hypothetical protein GCM10009571_10570 [Agromyces luteolus]
MTFANERRLAPRPFLGVGVDALRAAAKEMTSMAPSGAGSLSVVVELTPQTWCGCRETRHAEADRNMKA